jgi:FMN phosphatase YigB (HAD superfamily)
MILRKVEISLKMNRFALLVDVDNVLVSNKDLTTKVRANCAKFVKNITGRPITLDVASARTNNLCDTYGHTLRGIFSRYGVRDTKVGDYFIKEVYTDTLYRDLERYLLTPEFENRISGFREILQLCTTHEIPVSIFSNGPYDWCKKVVSAIEEIPYINDIYSCEHHIAYPGLFKPDPEIYYNVENHIRMKNINEIKEIVYIDNSLLNLEAVQFNRLWKPILFGHKSSNFCPTVKDFGDLKENLNGRLIPLDQRVYTIYLKTNLSGPCAKMVLRSCIPWLSEYRLDNIMLMSRVDGKSKITTLPESELKRTVNVLEENGFEVFVEEN